MATLTCTRSDVLAVGASFPAITLAVTVDSAAPDSLLNVAVVSGGNDDDPSNNSDDDPVTVTSAAPPLDTQVPVPVDARWALLLMVLAFMAMAARERRRLH